MSKKTKLSHQDTNKRKVGPASSGSKRFDPRDGLGVYIEHPEKNPESRVVEYDDEFVVIRDKFPKARSVLFDPRSFGTRVNDDYL